MERYRSGHNEAVLKTVCPQGRVGSNPTLSAQYRKFSKKLCRRVTGCMVFYFHGQRVGKAFLKNNSECFACVFIETIIYWYQENILSVNKATNM